MIKKVPIIVTVAALSCFLLGCYNHAERKQQDWARKILVGHSVVVRTEPPGTPLMVGEQLIEVISAEPDVKVSTLQFRELFAKDDPYRKRAMNDIWKVYCRTKQRVGHLHCVQGPDRWRDCEEFRECILWVYDESRHFSKPLYSDWLHCLFCRKSGFMSALFFLEHHQVIGAIVIDHDQPLQTLPNEARQERTEY